MCVRVKRSFHCCQCCVAFWVHRRCVLCTLRPIMFCSLMPSHTHKFHLKIEKYFSKCRWCWIKPEKTSTLRARTKWPFIFLSRPVSFPSIQRHAQWKQNALFKSSQIKSQNKLSERKKNNSNRACGNFVTSFFLLSQWCEKKLVSAFFGRLIVFFVF